MGHPGVWTPPLPRTILRLVPVNRGEVPVRRGSLSDQDFQRFPVSTVAVFALWLARQSVDDEDAVARLRATSVSPQAMRDAWGTLADHKPQDESFNRARRLLLEAADDEPPFVS
jgi:hypothetical protein